MVIPTWGNECGIAEYTKDLIYSVNDGSVKFRILNSIHDNFASMVVKNKIDIVHFQHEYSLYPIDLLNKVMRDLKFLRIPIITTLHTWSQKSDLTMHNKTIARKSTKIIVHSDKMKELCIQGGFPPEKMMVIPMGCRTYPLQPMEKIREENHIDGHPAIGFLGFPFPHKGIDSLIDALKQLKITFPNLKGYFLSHYPNYLNEHHPYYPFLQKLKSEFSRKSHLIWIKDYLPDTQIVNFLHGMDVNILPYKNHHQQGTSAAVKMLLAAKRPIITTDYLYFADLNEEVYKITGDNVDEIIKALHKTLLNKELQERLIKKGNSFLQTRSWEEIGKLYEDLYEQFVPSSYNKIGFRKD